MFHNKYSKVIFKHRTAFEDISDSKNLLGFKFRNVITVLLVFIQICTDVNKRKYRVRTIKIRTNTTDTLKTIKLIVRVITF